MGGIEPLLRDRDRITELSVACSMSYCIGADVVREI